MGLDIYAGPLCRYYAEDWELIASSVAQPLGIEVQVHRPRPLYPASKDRSVILSAVNEWRRQVVAQLVEAGIEAAEWSESYELPYRTDKPDHDGLSALRIVTAYSGMGISPWPKSIPENMDEEPVVNRFFQYDNGNLLENIELTIEFQTWIPAYFRGAMTRPYMPNGNLAFIGSVDVLCEALDQINGRVWKAPVSEISRWNRRGALAGTVLDLETKQFVNAPAESKDCLTLVEHMAQFGFSILYELAHWAKAHRMPMVVDA